MKFTSCSPFMAVAALAFGSVKAPTTTLAFLPPSTRKNNLHKTNVQQSSSVTQQHPCRPGKSVDTRIFSEPTTSVSAASLLSSPDDPQVFSTGYSPKADLLEAIQEATDNAVKSLPKAMSPDTGISLAIVTISSLYDGQASPSMVVPAVLSSASVYGKGIQNLVGCTTGGVVSSVTNYDLANFNSPDGGGSISQKQPKSSLPVENEGLPGVSVTLCLLPDVNIKTFHVLGEDVPDDVGRVSKESFKSAIGLDNFGGENNGDGSEPAFMLIPNPAFQNELDDLLDGIKYAYPSSSIFGGIASTVSSLSRARLFRYDASDPQCIQTLADGCVGLVMQGDLEIKTMIAQGAKPVGGVYRVVSGESSTIKAISLDEIATLNEKEANEEEGEEEEMDEAEQAKAAAAQQKAMIPKPPLAEANFLMKTLSDDDQSFMRKALLIGVERGGSMGRTPSDLKRLAEGRGHRFTVFQVASAGMKDGSVTLPLGSVDLETGTRLRYYVREGDFAKKEVEALWMGYKKRTLEETMMNSDDGKGMFTPSCCMLFSTLDRGTKLFGGKTGYETSIASDFLPALPSFTGFYSNGILGKLDDTESGSLETMVHGSAAQYVLIGSKSRRPVYSPAKAIWEEEQATKQEEEEAFGQNTSEEDEQPTERTPVILEQRAPRSEDGELVLKRREIHSGRAMTVSTVEWSVAEKTATPTSTLEGFMWDKETEVDRFRERVPLQNLVSQCKIYTLDPSKPSPRDWIGSVRHAGQGGNFVIIPECKRMEPTTGSLRKRYDVAKLTKQLTLAGAPAISINCDSVLFGGSLDDVSKAREASSSAALELSTTENDGVVVPPILASDLILYPYQLYKLRLAGADAVNLVAGSLASKDLLYLSKIAQSLKFQTLVSVTSEVQIRAITTLSPGSLNALIVSNRDLEDFNFDMTGQQALDLLKSDALKEFHAKHGDDVPVLVEGRVGLIERENEKGETSPEQYLKDLKDAGACGAIVAGTLASSNADDSGMSFEELTAAC